MSPVLLMIGDESPVTDAERSSERARTLIANVEIEIIPGAGHMIPVENPQIFNERVLRFIEAAP